MKRAHGNSRTTRHSDSAGASKRQRFDALSPGKEEGRGRNGFPRSVHYKDRSSYCIHSVEHALNVLEQFQLHEELGITDLSHLLKLHKNKVFRILATLESRKYIEQSKVSGNYRLGVRNLLLGQAFLQHTGLIAHSRPVQESMVRECEETCYVAIMRNLQTVYLDAVETPLAVRTLTRVGTRFPLHCTAEGKVLAAHVNPDTLLEHLVAVKLQQYTPTTITDRTSLLIHLQKVAKLGYAVETEELDDGVQGVSAPIKDHTRKVVGCLGISGPSMRLTPDRLKLELIPLVKRGAEQISRKLGYPR